MAVWNTPQGKKPVQSSKVQTFKAEKNLNSEAVERLKGV
jgi:hypothetical protein